MPGMTPYQQGSNAALKTVGLKPPAPPEPVGPPSPKPFQTAGVPASASAPAAASTLSPKLSAFSMSPNPETRAQEAQRDNVRQPPTNEDRRVATGIDPAFNYLGSPSESDPYTIPRLF